MRAMILERLAEVTPGSTALRPRGHFMSISFRLTTPSDVTRRYR